MSSSQPPKNEKLPPNLDSDIDHTDPDWSPHRDLVLHTNHQCNFLMTREWFLLVADSCQWIGLVFVTTIPMSFLNYIHPHNARGFNLLALAVAGVGSWFGMREYFGIYRARERGRERNYRGVYAPR